jgi:hypothetical protein
MLKRISDSATKSTAETSPAMNQPNDCATQTGASLPEMDTNIRGPWVLSRAMNHRIVRKADSNCDNREHYLERSSRCEVTFPEISRKHIKERTNENCVQKKQNSMSLLFAIPIRKHVAVDSNYGLLRRCDVGLRLSK